VSKNGAMMDYWFGQKNNWRRWAWNQASSLLTDKHAGVSLYLPSATDLDRKIALSKGFVDHNLIGVERNRSALQESRANGGLVIHGDFWDAVHCVARSSVAVSFVFGDFCSGLPHEDEYICAMNAASLPGTEKAIFCFNFMRGRDPSGNNVRNVFSKYAGKHRGQLFLYGLLSVFLLGMHRNLINCGATNEALGEFAGRWFKVLMPLYPAFDGSLLKARFNSYQSTTGQIFDSCCFANPFGVIESATGISLSQCRSANLINQRREFRLPAKTLNSTRAVLAHRTMRLNWKTADKEQSRNSRA